MANALKFGNGNWATKEDSVLAYNDENNNFKPLPFDFTRASTATYVDSDGLIKNAGKGEARIDYTDNTDGALKLEPQRTNLITYSDDLTTLTKTNTTITANQAVSPDGTLNADEIIGTGFARSTYAINNGDITVSCYVKSNDGSSKDFKMGAGSLGSIGNSTFTATSEWQRFTHTFSTTAQSTDFGFFATGGTSLGLYLFGFQLEQGSYPTSYIPTQGSTVTRLADSCSGAGNSEVFNDSEGVLYVEASSFVNGADCRITLSGGILANRVSIEFDANPNTIKGFMGNNGFLQSTSYNQTNNLKIALNYKANDFKMFINGVKIGTDISATASTGIDRIDFSNYNGDVPFLGICRDVRIYTTALTDTELAALTQA